MSSPPPITAADVSASWISTRREVIVRDGFALRGGPGCTIEIKSLTTNEWHWLTLPGGAIAFTTEGDRGAVLARLMGETETERHGDGEKERRP